MNKTLLAALILILNVNAFAFSDCRGAYNSLARKKQDKLLFVDGSGAMAIFAAGMGPGALSGMTATLSGNSKYEMEASLGAAGAGITAVVAREVIIKRQYKHYQKVLDLLSAAGGNGYNKTYQKYFKDLSERRQISEQQLNEGILRLIEDKLSVCPAGIPIKYDKFIKLLEKTMFMY